MITPLRDYVLLEELKPTVSSGIVLSENADLKESVRAKVIKIGQNVSQFKEGQIVLFKRHLFDEVFIDKIEYLLGREENVIAIYD